MKKRILLAALALCAIGFLIWLFPGSRDIDVTVQATEYRLDDPDYAVEHTVTLRGRETRKGTRFGGATFKGAVTISGFPELAEGAEVLISLGEHSITSIITEDSRFTHHTLFSLRPSRDYQQFFWLLENDNDGTSARTYGGDRARFLVSGPPDREAAFALAKELTKGTSDAPLFQ